MTIELRSIESGIREEGDVDGQEISKVLYSKLKSRPSRVVEIILANKEFNS
jgi:hypothetical protein